MAFREVSVVQVKEALRRWLKGEGERPIAQGVGIDRKTVRRYIAAAIELGVDRSGGEEQLGDELIGQVLERVRPHRPDGHGAPGGRCWVKKSRSRSGQAGPDGHQDRHLARPSWRGRPAANPGPLRRGSLRCREAHRDGPGDDPPPGKECQVDFGRLGLLADGERRRSARA